MSPPCMQYVSMPAGQRGQPGTGAGIDGFDDEDQILDYTVRERRRIIVTMVGEDGASLKDLSLRHLDVLLAALDGMDRVALGKKRLKSENLALASQAAAAAIIARILGTPGIGQGALLARQQQGITVLPASVPEPVLVPGETDMDAAQMDVDTFMAGFSAAA
ncbi:hypothetical protein [Paraburkholderia adhaesiva]|uniref:hypothetical protein n=1 Tax=Paraburkholderia adhaesiva TaxID=2883244 RepID=UPI001F390BA9|nr:hypothetical protein [Paraburkholderia adhaesiva]